MAPGWPCSQLALLLAGLHPGWLDSWLAWLRDAIREFGDDQEAPRTRLRAFQSLKP